MGLIPGRSKTTNSKAEKKGVEVFKYRGNVREPKLYQVEEWDTKKHMAYEARGKKKATPGQGGGV